jgi:hypothetical protein
MIMHTHYTGMMMNADAQQPQFHILRAGSRVDCERFWTERAERAPLGAGFDANPREKITLVNLDALTTPQLDGTEGAVLLDAYNHDAALHAITRLFVNHARQHDAQALRDAGRHQRELQEQLIAADAKIAELEGKINQAYHVCEGVIQDDADGHARLAPVLLGVLDTSSPAMIHLGSGYGQDQRT